MIGRLQDLPRVDVLMERPELGHLPRALVRAAVQVAVGEARAAVRAGGQVELDAVVHQAARWAEAELAPSIRPVINATGVVLHTNLGRAPWSAAAVQSAAEVAGAWCNLELRLRDGQRGGRGEGVERLLCELTGAEAALVVNNGAAAILLALSAHAAGRGVVVSRGELVEIGGSFRVPDVLAVSGATLVEVGTTNRTRVEDYERAIRADTAALLAVHPSNFAMSGFVATVPFAELAALARSRGVLAFFDVGSGALEDIGGEPPVRQTVAEGADAVTFSGDKLLGGPQAGLVVGRATVIAAMKRHPLYRALRVDKVILAGLEATLKAWRWGVPVPVEAARRASAEALHGRASRVARTLVEAGLKAEVREISDTTGGGSLPSERLDGWGVVIEAGALDEVQRRLRLGDPPIVARVADGRLIVSLRTVFPVQDDQLAAGLAERVPTR